MQLKPQPPTHPPPEPSPPTETLLPLHAIPSHLPPPLISPPSKQPHLYFAYGSNLSPTQMSHRCTHNPHLSATPLAIAILPHWRWHINEAGYANVLPPVALRVAGSPQTSPAAENIPISGSQDAVYGVLYEMDPRDERVLDGYEGVDWMAGPSETDTERRSEEVGCFSGGMRMRPRAQGEGDYNKWYIDAEVVRWFDDAGAWSHIRTGMGSQDEDGKKARPLVRVLVYVDEERVTVSRPKAEYIARMNRAMREAEGLGVDGGWLRDVIRRFIPEQ